jgi:hypothetical protein
MAANTNVRTTCITTCADKNGQPLVLVVKDNGESFFSFIFRLTNLSTGEREAVYEAPVWLTSMWRAPGGAIFAVDADGLVHSNETGAFTTKDTQSKPGLTCVWGLDDEQVFACGGRGMAVRKSGTQWLHFDDGLAGDLYELRGTAVDDLYVVGEEGRIFHHNGRAWAPIDPPTNYILNSVLCRSPEQVYVCGEGGAVFEGSLSRWRPLNAPTVTFYSLALFQGRVYLAAGADGIFAVDGNTVSLIKKGRTFYDLVSSPEMLFATGDDFAGRFDGKEWKGNRFS